MEKVTITRQELYGLVWSEPITTLAKKYHISDNGLRKICKRMNITLYYIDIGIYIEETLILNTK